MVGGQAAKGNEPTSPSKKAGIAATEHLSLKVNKALIVLSDFNASRSQKISLHSGAADGSVAASKQQQQQQQDSGTAPKPNSLSICLSNKSHAAAQQKFSTSSSNKLATTTQVTTTLKKQSQPQTASTCRNQTHRKKNLFSTSNASSFAAASGSKQPGKKSITTTSSQISSTAGGGGGGPIQRKMLFNRTMTQNSSTNNACKRLSGGKVAQKLNEAASPRAKRPQPLQNPQQPIMVHSPPQNVPASTVFSPRQKGASKQQQVFSMKLTKTPRVVTQTQVSICDLSDTSSLKTEVQDQELLVTDADFVDKAQTTRKSRSRRRKNSVPTMNKINLMLSSGALETLQSVGKASPPTQQTQNSKTVPTVGDNTQQDQKDLQTQLLELKSQIDSQLTEVYRMHATLYHDVQFLKQTLGYQTPMPADVKIQRRFDQTSPVHMNESSMRLAKAADHQTFTVSKTSKKYAQGSESTLRTKNKKSTAQHKKNKRSFIGIEPFSTSRNGTGGGMLGSPTNISVHHKNRGSAAMGSISPVKKVIIPLFSNQSQHDTSMTMSEPQKNFLSSMTCDITSNAKQLSLTRSMINKGANQVASKTTYRENELTEIKSRLDCTNMSEKMVSPKQSVLQIQTDDSPKSEEHRSSISEVSATDRKGGDLVNSVYQTQLKTVQMRDSELFPYHQQHSQQPYQEHLQQPCIETSFLPESGRQLNSFLISNSQLHQQEHQLQQLSLSAASPSTQRKYPSVQPVSAVYGAASGGFQENRLKHATTLVERTTRSNNWPVVNPQLSEQQDGRRLKMSEDHAAVALGSRAMLKNKSRSMTSFQTLIAQKGSKCACMVQRAQNNIFDQFQSPAERSANNSEQRATTCGVFCKKLGPEEQRIIIQKLVRQDKHRVEQEQQEAEMMQSQSSLLLTEEYSIDNTQTAGQNAAPFISDENLVRYLIHSKWWQTWCDYSNFNQDFRTTETEEAASVNFTQMAAVTHEEAGRSNVLYGRPSMISNAELLLDPAAKSSCGDSGTLKANLTEYYDYVCVSKSVWSHLYSWFSADYVIFRKLKRQDRHLEGPGAKLVLDLYPVQQRKQQHYN